MAIDERWNAGTLRLRLVVACGDARCGPNGQCDVGAAADAFRGAEVDVKSVGAFAGRGSRW